MIRPRLAGFEVTGDITKAVLNRCKSILAAGPDFFSTTSPHQRVQGPEIHQRIAQVFVEQIERDPGQILTLKCTYDLFSQFLKEKNMPVLTRPEVKVMLGGGGLIFRIHSSRRASRR